MAQTNGFTVWFTGMLGTGKTSLANYIAARLRQVDRNVEILDEDSLADDLWKGVEDTKDERIDIVDLRFDRTRTTYAWMLTGRALTETRVEGR